MTYRDEYAEAIEQLNRAWNVFNNEGSESSIYLIKASEIRVTEILKLIKSSKRIISDSPKNSNRRTVNK